MDKFEDYLLSQHDGSFIEYAHLSSRDKVRLKKEITKTASYRFYALSVAIRKFAVECKIFFNGTKL